MMKISRLFFLTLAAMAMGWLTTVSASGEGAFDSSVACTDSDYSLGVNLPNTDTITADSAPAVPWSPDQIQAIGTLDRTAIATSEIPQMVAPTWSSIGEDETGSYANATDTDDGTIPLPSIIKGQDSA